MSSISDKLSGPTRSRNAIKELEGFLAEHCKTAKKLDEILEVFQYATGHEPRKTMQYISAIKTATGNITIFKNGFVEYIIFGTKADAIGALGKLSERFNVKTMSKELMIEEEPPESFMEHVAKKEKEKARQFPLQDKARREKEKTKELIRNAASVSRADNGHEEDGEE